MNLFDRDNYPLVEPVLLIAGDRWVWKRADLGDDYPPASYQLKYSLRLHGTTTVEIEITAAEAGSDYLVEVAAATTAGYTAGVYTWQAYIIRSSDSERVTVGYGTIEVAPNRDVATTDPRSHARKMLAAVEAVLENRATLDQQSYTIHGRSLQRTPIADLLKLRGYYRAEVGNELAAERNRQGKGSGNRVRARFRG